MKSCQDKTLAISDRMLENDQDILALGETLLKLSTDANVIDDLALIAYSLRHMVRQWLNDNQHSLKNGVASL